MQNLKSSYYKCQPLLTQANRGEKVVVVLTAIEKSFIKLEHEFRLGSSETITSKKEIMSKTV